MNKLNFGLIGTGFMGKAHAIALRSVATVFPGFPVPELRTLVDSDAAKAEQLAAAWGFSGSSDNWRSVCDDPAIDVVDICTPNHLHHEMALSAIAAGKHVYCEKPLALTTAQAREIWLAAEKSGLRTSMGFNYMCNPLITLARDIINSGEIGTPFNFRGSYLEDYMADANTPHSWRCLRDQGGSGALADLGTHLINMAEYLLGPMSSVLGSMTTVHTHRPHHADDSMCEVENEDIAQILVEFERGFPGTMEFSRIASGRKCGLCFEINGSKGSLVFDQERMNEIRLYDVADASGRRGFRTILAGPEHVDYAAFCPAPGHGLGINDLKVIEVRNLLQSIADDQPIFSDFANGYRVQFLVGAIEQSHREKRWVNVSPEQQNSEEQS